MTILRRLIVAGLLALCFLAFCAGLTFPFELIVLLAAGWLMVLVKDLPRVTFDWSNVAAAIIFYAIFAIGLHWLLRSMWRDYRQTEPLAGEEQTASSSSLWSWRWTGTIAALVVLAFVAGISMVGITHQIAWLATAPEPIIQNTFSDFYVSLRSTNDLRGTANGFNQFAIKNGAFPPGASTDPNGQILHGWQTLLLPYTDNQELFAKIAIDRPWHDAQNLAVFRRPLFTAYGVDPRDYGTPPTNGLAPSTYAGNSHVLGHTRGRRENEFGDGLSNTIMAGEVMGPLPAWGRPGNWRDPADGLLGDENTFGSPWKRGVNFVFADGSVRIVNRSIDPNVLRAMATPNSADHVQEDYR